MSSLSSQPYKGTRDIYPEDMRLRNYIFRTWRQVVTRFGYEEYAAPMLEPLEVYAAKSGDELANEQTYSFEDRGGRQVAIRPELTPSVSRMVAARRQEMAYPARLFNIGNFMRYERPQRGREREFWQLNLDVFGAEGALPEAEVITIGDNILRQFGAKPSMYRIRINNRKLVDAMMRDYLELDIVQSQLMIRLFDRRDKVSKDDFAAQAADIFGSEQASEGLKRLSIILSASSIAELPESLQASPAVAELQQVFDELKNNQVQSAEFDITLMRGLDYYTGVVFEFFDTDPKNARALFGGGRYDGLVGLFGADPLSAVGMAPGLSMTELFLETHGLVPKLHSTTDVYIATLGDNYKASHALASKLRSEGVSVELDSTDRKLEKQLKTAIKKQIAYAIVVGEDEAKTQNFKLRNLDTAKDEAMSLERIIVTLADYRHDGSDFETLLHDI